MVLVFVSWQEVEPTVGEQLCRLFPLDENIDLRRIAQIARQSLKLRDPSTGKTTSASSRSASDLSSQPAPPGVLSAVSDSSSTRSDKLLLGLYDKDSGRTLMWHSRDRTSREMVGRGTWRCSLHNCRTYFTDVLSRLRSNELLKTGLLGRILADILIILSLLRFQELAKTRLGRIQMDILYTEKDVYSEIPSVPWTFKRTLLQNPAGRSSCCMNCGWGRVIDRTVSLTLSDVKSAVLTT